MGASAYTIERTAAHAGGRRRTWLIVVGVVLVVVGLIAAVGFWVAAARRLDDAVTNLARAPIGCTTTLNFSQTGEFLIYVESEGVLDDVRGDCDAAGRFGSTSGEPLPVSLSMVDPDGQDVDLPLRSGTEYDAAGFVGRSERVVTISTTGDHVLTVDSDEVAPTGGAFSAFGAVAIGKDPNSGVAVLRLGAVLAGLIGVIAGIVCIVLGNRRRAAPAVDAPWPAAGWPPAQGGTPPSWPGVQAPPTGPPQAWPTSPPTVSPPGVPPPQQPAAPPTPIGEPPAPWSPMPQPGRPAGPSSRPADGSTGDGERSPWAPPQDG